MTGPSTMAHHHELHERIRVLEAEVLKWKKAADGVWDHVWEAKDRAERAEARLAEAQVLLLQRLNAEYDAWTPIQRRDWLFATGAFLSRSPPERESGSDTQGRVGSARGAPGVPPDAEAAAKSGGEYRCGRCGGPKEGNEPDCRGELRECLG